MARATSSLPVPRSPRSRTVTSVSATRLMRSATGPKDARCLAVRMSCTTRNAGELVAAPLGLRSLSVMGSPPRRQRRSLVAPFIWRQQGGCHERSRATDAGLLDLVQQCLIAHPEDLGGFAAVPVDLPQCLFDGYALSFHRSRLRNRGQ